MKEIIKTEDIKKISNMPNSDKKTAEAVALVLHYYFSESRLDGALATIIEFANLVKNIPAANISLNAKVSILGKLNLDRIQYNENNVDSIPESIVEWSYKDELKAELKADAEFAKQQGWDGFIKDGKLYGVGLKSTKFEKGQKNLAPEQTINKKLDGWVDAKGFIHKGR